MEDVRLFGKWEMNMEDGEMPLFSSARTVAAAKAFRIMEDVGYFLFLLFFGGFFNFHQGFFKNLQNSAVFLYFIF